MANDVLATGLMSLAMHESVYFGRSLPWIVVDALPALFRRFKIQAGKMPSVGAVGVREPRAAEPLHRRDLADMVFALHMEGVELNVDRFFHPICTYFGLAYGVPFPPVWKMAYQIAIFFVMEDAWHYWTHRWMHESAFMYKTVHKIHHQYSAPFGLAAEYASPIEVMFLGLGTVGSPNPLLRHLQGSAHPDRLPVDYLPPLPSHRRALRLRIPLEPASLPPDLGWRRPP